MPWRTDAPPPREPIINWRSWDETDHGPLDLDHPAYSAPPSKPLTALPVLAMIGIVGFLFLIDWLSGAL